MQFYCKTHGYFQTSDLSADCICGGIPNSDGCSKKEKLFEINGKVYPKLQAVCEIIKHYDSIGETGFTYISRGPVKNNLERLAVGETCVYYSALDVKRIS